jgi:hypothetical protein
MNTLRGLQKNLLFIDMLRADEMENEMSWGLIAAAE